MAAHSFPSRSKTISAKGWLLNSINASKKSVNLILQLKKCIDSKVNSEIYRSNQHVKEKMRLKLQFLHDKGFWEFVGKGYLSTSCCASQLAACSDREMPWLGLRIIIGTCAAATSGQAFGRVRATTIVQSVDLGIWHHTTVRTRRLS